MVSSIVVKIPNAEKIRAAKEQRRRARAQRDYIPLDADQDSEAELGDGARDDSDKEHGSNDEPDDHERRIQFAPKSKTLREQMTEKMGKTYSRCRSRHILIRKQTWLLLMHVSAVKLFEHNQSTKLFYICRVLKCVFCK